MKSRLSCLQQGFLMPLALFILVGLAVLMTTMMRFSSHQHTSTVFNALSSQAFYAADSGVEYGVHKIVSSGIDAGATRCSLINEHVIEYDVEGLSGCRVLLRCGDRDDHYMLSSLGECGRNQLLAQRQITIKIDKTDPQTRTWREPSL